MTTILKSKDGKTAEITVTVTMAAAQARDKADETKGILFAAQDELTVAIAAHVDSGAKLDEEISTLQARKAALAGLKPAVTTET